MQQIDDKSWFPKLSPETHGVDEMRNQFAPMRDGGWIRRKFFT